MTQGVLERFSEEQAYEFFKKHTFAVNGGQPFCPKPACKCSPAYTYKPRWNAAKTRSRIIYKCKRCDSQFTATSGRLLASHKLSFKEILLSMFEFTSAAKGFAALHLSLKRGYDYKVAWAFNHKLREAMMRELASIVLHDEVEIDGKEIGGYIKPKNPRRERKSDPETFKKNAWKIPYRGKKKLWVVSATQRGGPVRTTVVKSEGEAKAFLRSIISKDVTLFADQHGGYDELIWDFPEFKRINHSECFWTGEAHTNNAENYNSMLQRMETGIYHRISHPRYLPAYAEEMAWRMTNKTLPNGDKLEALIQAAGLPGRSKYRGMWRRRPVADAMVN